MRRLATAVLFLGAALATGNALENESPPEEEIALALSACPPHLSQQAGVYATGKAGFVRARPSTNGFNSLVERSEPGEVAPQCLDREGSETVLPRLLLEAELRAQGKAASEVAAAVSTAYAEGRLRVPQRLGVNYMLSKENRIVGKDGKAVPFPPHLMFYAPYRTNAELGLLPGPGARIFISGEGKPGSYLIIHAEDTHSLH